MTTQDAATAGPPEQRDDLLAEAERRFARQEWQAAREHYQRHAHSAGTPEEVWHSVYRAGLCSLRLDAWEQGLVELLEAWELQPQRSEPLYQLAREARLRSRNDLALMLARQALANPLPPAGSYALDPHAYRIGPLEELSICAFYTTQRALGQAACEALLHRADAGGATRDMAVRNLTYYLQPPAFAFTRPLAAPAGLEHEGSWWSFGALLPDGAGYVALLRRQSSDPATRVFAGPAARWRQVAANVLLHLDADLHPRAAHEIADRVTADTDERTLLHGIADARLLGWDGAWWLCGVAALHAAPGERGQVLARLGPDAGIHHVAPLTFEGPAAACWDQGWLPVGDEHGLRLIAAFDPTLVLEADPHTGICRTLQRGVPPVYLRRYRPAAAPVRYRAGYLCAVYDVAVIEGRRVNLHRLVELGADLSAQRATPLFILREAGQELLGGLCPAQDGEQLLLGWSSGPEHLWVSGLPVAALEQMLRPIENLTTSIAALS